MYFNSSLTHLAHSIHTNILAPRVAGCTINHSAAMAVEKVLPSWHAVELTGILSCHKDHFQNKTKLSPFICHVNHKISWYILTSVIREPLVALPMEVHAIKLGALLFAEILGSLWTVLRRRQQ